MSSVMGRSPEPLMVQLVRARLKAGISQARLGDMLGVTQTAISYWESGAREIDLRMALRYALAVGRVLTLDQESTATARQPSGVDR